MSGDLVTDVVLTGVLGSGVNLATVGVLNLTLAGAVACLTLLLALSLHGNTALVPHVVFLLLLAIGLWVLINWFVREVGLADPEAQRKEVEQLLQPPAAVEEAVTSVTPAAEGGAEESVPGGLASKKDS